MVADTTPQRQGEAIERVPFESYYDLPDLHATAIKDMLVSPRLYKARREKKRPDNDTLRRGRAIHTAILEPTRFLADYVLWTGKVRRGKKWDAFREEHAGKTILTPQQYETAQQAARAVLEHDTAGEILSDRKARRELTLRWTHVRTGLRCKARIDFLGTVLADIKSAGDPSPRRFSSSAGRYGYASQLAFYADGVAAVLGQLPPVKIIAVQSVEPYDVVVFNVNEKVQGTGRELVEKAIDRIAECTATRAWPGIAPTGEVELELPLWAAPDYEEDGPDESQPIEDAAF